MKGRLGPNLQYVFLRKRTLCLFLLLLLVSDSLGARGSSSKRGKTKVYTQRKTQYEQNYEDDNKRGKKPNQ